MPFLVLPALLSFWSLLACQDPFAEDRHDLASFRIAGVSGSTDASGSTRLRAAVWSGLGAWHDVPPVLGWSAPGDTTVTALGEDATLAFAVPGSVDLTAEAATGSAEVGTETAQLDLAAGAVAPPISGFVREAVDLDITHIGDPIATREAVAPTSDVPVVPGSAVRLTLGVADGTTVHWMGTGGQFAELDYRTTDWFAGTATFSSSNAVTSTTNIDPGVYTLLALVIDGAGDNSWYWIDVDVDDAATPGPMLYTAGRILPVDLTEPSAGFYAATVAEAASTAGVTLTNVAPVADASASPALCGNDAGAAFDFGPMVEGWCPRGDMIGHSVVLNGEIR